MTTMFFSRFLFLLPLLTLALAAPAVNDNSNLSKESEAGYVYNHYNAEGAVDSEESKKKDNEIDGEAAEENGDQDTAEDYADEDKKKITEELNKVVEKAEDIISPGDEDNPFFSLDEAGEKSVDKSEDQTEDNQVDDKLISNDNMQDEEDEDEKKSEAEAQQEKMDEEDRVKEADTSDHNDDSQSQSRQVPQENPQTGYPQATQRGGYPQNFNFPNRGGYLPQSVNQQQFNNPYQQRLPYQPPPNVQQPYGYNGYAPSQNQFQVPAAWQGGAPQNQQQQQQQGYQRQQQPYYNPALRGYFAPNINQQIQNQGPGMAQNQRQPFFPQDMRNSQNWMSRFPIIQNQQQEGGRDGRNL